MKAVLVWRLRQCRHWDRLGSLKAVLAIVIYTVLVLDVSLDFTPWFIGTCLVAEKASVLRELVSDLIFLM